MLRSFTGRNYLFNKCFFCLPKLKMFYLYVKSQTKSLPATERYRNMHLRDGTSENIESIFFQYKIFLLYKSLRFKIVTSQILNTLQFYYSFGNFHCLKFLRELGKMFNKDSNQIILQNGLHILNFYTEITLYTLYKFYN